jgi:hypothetical protein
MCLSMHVFNIVSGRRDHAIDGGYIMIASKRLVLANQCYQ